MLMRVCEIVVQGFTLVALNVSRSTAYRLVKLARDEEKAERAFLDDRLSHPYKITEPVPLWMTEFCTNNPQIPLPEPRLGSSTDILMLFC